LPTAAKNDAGLNVRQNIRRRVSIRHARADIRAKCRRQIGRFGVERPSHAGRDPGFKVQAKIGSSCESGWQPIVLIFRPLHDREIARDPLQIVVVDLRGQPIEADGVDRGEGVPSGLVDRKLVRGETKRVELLHGGLDRGVPERHLELRLRRRLERSNERSAGLLLPERLPEHLAGLADEIQPLLVQGGGSDQVLRPMRLVQLDRPGQLLQFLGVLERGLLLLRRLGDVIVGQPGRDVRDLPGQRGMETARKHLCGPSNAQHVHDGPVDQRSAPDGLLQRVERVVGASGHMRAQVVVRTDGLGASKERSRRPRGDLLLDQFVNFNVRWNRR
jgi:hypothetical protein